MKMPWLAAVLNFFFMGLGYIYNGRRRVLGIGWTAAAIGLTYVEMSLRVPMPNLYWTMFVSVFIANTCFATDGWREAEEINRQLKR
mgnify:CR=1 FL=1